MARILAIDYGKKRTGLAVTDELQIIAGGLTTVSTPELVDYILGYVYGRMRFVGRRIQSYRGKPSR